eukprot:PITA_16019
MGWKIHQIDVKTNFLNGVIEEEVHIGQHEGFDTFDRESHVFKLERTLYGLKQEPHAWYTRNENYFTREKMSIEILKKFHMESNKPMETPLAGNWRKEDATLGEVVEATIYMQLVGSLMHLVKTRLNMSYAVNELSQAMVKPTKLYWKETKNVLRYLRGTTQFGLWYKGTYGVKLQGFTNADWPWNPSNMKSTSG